ncbi:DNA polymerase III subunit beta [Kitasatospora sp. NPDC088264]|uniref:DNA polymerase III subunit beta n=1 Tax=Kitasatospora sp. NPDC088264 TaxID=3155296 RepID=UPI00343210A0
MKLRAHADVLAEAVTYTAKALPSRHPLPVMHGMLLTTGPEGLSLSASDGEVYTTSTVAAEIADGGQVLISGRLLNDICGKLPKAGEVDFELAGARLILSCGSARFTLPTLPEDEYPTLPDMPEVVASLGADAFAEAVGQVAVAVGRDDTLPVLTGIQLRMDGEQLVLAATDRYRVARREITVHPSGTLPTAAKKKRRKGADDQAVDAAVAEVNTALIPGKTLADAARALDGEHVLRLHWSDGLFGLSVPGGRSYMTRLLDTHEFPKVDALMGSGRTLTVTMQAVEAVAAVQRVALVAARNTPVRLFVTDGELLIEAGSGDDAQALDRIPADADGEADGTREDGTYVIAFNPGYLVDALKSPGTTEVQIEFGHPHKPARIVGRTGEATESYQHVLMPVRIDG